MKVYSFDVGGDFAAFKDPTVTTSQDTYLVPSKSAIVGLLGAAIGITRMQFESEIFSKEFQDFLSKTSVGVEVLGEGECVEKVTINTNHRSLKAAKTMPFKTEFLVNPTYRIYFTTSKAYENRLEEVFSKNSFVYTPYLGHAYCIARISGFKSFDGKLADAEKGIKTKTVVLSEESRERNVSVELRGLKGTLVVERHLHHFFENGSLTSRVLRYYVPIGTDVEIKSKPNQKWCSFHNLGEKVVCLF